MKQIKRIVDTSFWSDDKVLEFSPEDKYFMLFLLTNEYTSQLGIYHLPLKKASLDLGYSQDSVKVLLDRFENKYGIIKYSEETSEVAIKNYLLYSIISGGKPVLDCLLKETDNVKDITLLGYIYHNLSSKNLKNETVIKYINILSERISNDLNYLYINDNERIVHESSTNRPPKKSNHFVPPTLDEVKEYCRSNNKTIDPEAFWYFYESKNWFIGKNKMSNWHMAIGTWERKDREYGRSNTYQTESKPKYRLSDV